jgi:hypothetical protein
LTLQNARKSDKHCNNSVLTHAMEAAENAQAIIGGRSANTGLAITASNSAFTNQAAVNAEKAKRLIYSKNRQKFRVLMLDKTRIPDTGLRKVMKIPQDLVFPKGNSNKLREHVAELYYPVEETNCFQPEQTLGFYSVN